MATKSISKSILTETVNPVPAAESDAVMTAAQAEFAASPIPCQVCKTTEDVAVRWDPYQYEIHDRFLLLVVCDSCDHDIAWEI